MGKRSWRPENAMEGELLAHRAVKASRQFLQGNPEGRKSIPSMSAWNAAADHAEAYPGDIPMYEGQPAPKGKRAK